MATDVVTGEAVALDIRVARLASRALAVGIDLAIQGIVLYTGASVVALTLTAVDSAVAVGLSVVLTALVIVGYPATLETLTRGRSVGKLALGLRVVGDDGGPVRFRQALTRALAGFVEFWILLGSPALICSLLNGRGKRLGDLFAGTIVIQERVPAGTFFGPVAVMPPQLAGWASALELSLLPGDLALAARQYLTRFWELVPQVRDTMGERLTREVLGYVSPPPPGGLRPEIYLSAVLAERRRREERRLAERAARRASIARRGRPAPVGAPPPPTGPMAPAGTAPGAPPWPQGPPVPEAGRPRFLPPHR